MGSELSQAKDSPLRETHSAHVCRNCGTPTFSRTDAAARIAAQSEVAENGCWVWFGSVNAKGYGRLTFDHRAWRAHRLSYEAFVGAIPVDTEIHHTCETTNCVNPLHLDLIDPVEHLKLHRAVTHCKHGHELTPENTRIRGDGKRACRACKHRSLAQRASGTDASPISEEVSR